MVSQANVSIAEWVFGWGGGGGFCGGFFGALLQFFATLSGPSTVLLPSLALLQFFACNAAKETGCTTVWRLFVVKSGFAGAVLPAPLINLHLNLPIYGWGLETLARGARGQRPESGVLLGVGT